MARPIIRGMSMPIIRGTAACYDVPTLPSRNGERLVMRRGCFNGCDLNCWTTLANMGHDDTRELASCGGGGLRLWLDDTGLQFEIQAKDSPLATLVMRGIPSGLYRGSSVGALHSGSRTITVGGEECVEVVNVVSIRDIAVCVESASTFTGLCLIDRSQSPAMAGRQARKPPARKSAGAPVAYQKWAGAMRASTLKDMEKKMMAMATERLGHQPPSVRTGDFY